LNKAFISKDDEPLDDCLESNVHSSGQQMQMNDEVLILAKHKELLAKARRELEARERVLLAREHVLFDEHPLLQTDKLQNQFYLEHMKHRKNLNTNTNMEQTCHHLDGTAEVVIDNSSVSESESLSFLNGLSHAEAKDQLKQNVLRVASLLEVIRQRDAENLRLKSKAMESALRLDELESRLESMLLQHSLELKETHAKYEAKLQQAKNILNEIQPQ